MTAAFPTCVELERQEAELRFTRFDNDDAWRLGCSLTELARQRRAPVAIDIRRNGHQLFHYALPGASPDNDSWIERKARVVDRFGHSSLYMGQLCREADTTLEAKFGLEPARYAPHGGAFPLLIAGVGPVGVIAVSGLPQLDDHALIVEVLRDQI